MAAASFVTLRVEWARVGGCRGDIPSLGGTRDAWRKRNRDPGAQARNLEEARENAEEQCAPWLTWLSLSTAMLAVLLAAIASLESGDHANEAIVLKTDATLTQSAAGRRGARLPLLNRPSRLKEDMYRALTSARAAPRGRRRMEQARERRGDKEGGAENGGGEARRRGSRRADAESKHHPSASTHQFAKSVTIFQVAIADGGKRSAAPFAQCKKGLWWVSLGVGTLGAVFLALA